MMTRLMAALVLASLVAGGALFAASPVVGQEQEQEPQEAKRQPLVSLSGADSKLDRGYYRLTSAEHFTEIYMRHLGQDPADFDAYHNPHGVPMINFDECMVVAVFQGEDWNSAGVIVDSIVEDEHRMTVRFDDRAYQTFGPDGGAQRVRAYGFFVLPRTDKMLVLEENVQSIIGEPPEWKERVRIPREGVW